MIRRPSARAAWIIRSASRMPPDLVSLMLTPSPRPHAAATSGSVWQLSSSTIGIGSCIRCSSSYASDGGGRQRLLDQLDVERDQLRADVARELDRPRLVGVDADQRVRRLAADDAHALQVVGTAHLDLQGVVAGGPPGPVGRPLHRVDADRVRRGRDRRPGRARGSATAAGRRACRPGRSSAESIAQRAAIWSPREATRPRTASMANGSSPRSAAARSQNSIAPGTDSP